MNADGCEAVVRFRAYFYTKVPLRQNVYVCCDIGSPMRKLIVRLKLHYATDMGRCTVTLPSLGVVFTQSLTEVLVPACVVSFLVVFVHVNFVRILL